MALRTGILGLAAAMMLGLAACAPIPTVLDTPKNGDTVAISVDQPMQVRWANQSPAHGAWVLQAPPVDTALKTVGRKTEQPPGGAMAVDVFDFVGAQPGSQQLTFVYRRKDGVPPTPEEQITITVGVS
ncbi:MAG: hypothetical protein JNK30_15630 [Phenylobacterium sp.]|uniref:protease inhibitor I42 family protein n=1 Tax=Phenylobacterium sp. TaxID=1871053 RepID=UPI001A363D02|nr:protease inhibitor I42 family protein [Phenylobacterium sp.]MBL8772812.1 hypothetical protein [Phenylobacterium sp.]